MISGGGQGLAKMSGKSGKDGDRNNPLTLVSKRGTKGLEQTNFREGTSWDSAPGKSTATPARHAEAAAKFIESQIYSLNWLAEKKDIHKNLRIFHTHFEDRVLECLSYLSLQLSFWSIAAAARNLKENLIFSNMMQLINIKTGKLK